MSEIPQHMLKVRTQIAQRFIAGSGIEIGALHSPLEIGSGAQVRYVERLPLDKLREHYPELQGYEIIEPDILDDGEVLSSIENNTLDFIIANHMLEHCENPLGAIRNHLRKVRPGGILYYAIPEKKQGFDAPREVTSFIHLVEDDLWGPETSQLRHFWEWVTFVLQTRDPKEAAEKVEELKKRNHSIHYHVWDEMAFREFVMGTQKYLHNTFFVEYLERNDTEVVTVFRKTDLAWNSINNPSRMVNCARSNFEIIVDQLESTQRAHAEERDRLEAELRHALQERTAEISQARKTIDGLVKEIDQARSNIHILVDEIEQARKAHLERDHLEVELRHALQEREAEISQARKTIDGLVKEIDQARSNIHILVNEIEQARKAHQERDHLEIELRHALMTQDDRIRELTTQLQSLMKDMKQIRKSWSHRLFHPLEAYLRGKR